jgi:hypothetical protein
VFGPVGVHHAHNGLVDHVEDEGAGSGVGVSFLLPIPFAQVFEHGQQALFVLIEVFRL